MRASREGETKFSLHLHPTTTNVIVIYLSFISLLALVTCLYAVNRYVLFYNHNIMSYSNNKTLNSNV